MKRKLPIALVTFFISASALAQNYNVNATDPYEILGLSQAATQSELDAQLANAALKYPISPDGSFGPEFTKIMDAYESIIQSRTAVEMADVAPTTQQVNQLFGQMSESFKKVDAEVAAKLAPSKQQQALMESQKLLKEFNNAQLIDHIIDHYNMLDHLKPALTEMVYNREDPILIKNLVRKIAQHPDKDKIVSIQRNFVDVRPC